MDGARPAGEDAGVPQVSSYDLPMPLPRYFEDLFRHMTWADATVWRTVIGTPFDEKTYHLLFHIHQVQHAFLSVWRGEERAPFRELSDYPDFPSLLAWAREFHEQLPAHLAGVGEDQLDDTKEVTWRRWVEKTIGRAPEPSTLGETMLQLTQHSTYHRGQVNSRLRATGVEPPLTDFIAWVWRGKPAPEWPA